MGKIVTILILLNSLIGFSQNGKVVDKTGEPLPLVNVYSPKYDMSVTTDFDGYFNIDVPVGTPLIFSFISYQTDTIKAYTNMVVNMSDRSFNSDNTHNL